MEPLGHGAIPSLHLGDLRERLTLPVRLLRARAAARFRLQLLGALLHRGSFLVRESLGRFAGGSLGGLLRALLQVSSQPLFSPMPDLMGRRPHAKEPAVSRGDPLRRLPASYLLPQPGGFESFRAVPVRIQGGDSTGVNRQDVRGLQFERRPTRPTLPETRANTTTRSPASRKRSGYRHSPHTSWSIAVSWAAPSRPRNRGSPSG